MKKYFVLGKEDEPCYPMSVHVDTMKMNNLPSLTLVEAEISIGEGFFYCRFHCEVGEKSHGGCGKSCKEYKPRNKKSGRCLYSAHCYNSTDKTIVITNKNLTN